MEEGPPEDAFAKLGWLGRRRARNARKRLAEWGSGDHPSASVIFLLRQRALASLRRAAVFLVLLFLTVIAGLAYFVAVPLYQEWLARQTDADRARQEERLSAEARELDALEADLAASTAAGLAGTWRELSAGTDAPVRDIVMPRPGTGILLAGAGEIRRTQDDGISWLPVALPVPGGLEALDSREGIAWAVGAGGTILRSDDGGASWVPQPSGTEEDLTGVSFATAEAGWAFGATVLLRTTDGGARWRILPGLPPPGAEGPLLAVGFFDGRTGMAAIGSQPPSVYRTEDAGAGWRRLDLDMPPGAGSIAAIDMASPTSGLLLFDEGLSSFDGAGGDWRLTSYHRYHAYDMRAAGLHDVLQAGGDGWVAGEGGTLLETRDGGATWPAVQTGIDDALLSLAISPGPPAGAVQQRVWAGGEDGRVLVRFPDAVPPGGPDLQAVRQLVRALGQGGARDMAAVAGQFEALDRVRSDLQGRRAALSASASAAKTSGQQAVEAAARLAASATDAAGRERALALLDIALRQQQGGSETVWRYAADRVPAGILILFLLSTLSALYRYNTRLAGFYHARADALELGRGVLGAEAAALAGQLAQMLAADGVEFRDVKTPSDQAAGIAREFAARMPGRG